MIDVVAELLEAITDDEELVAAFGTRVYGHRIPQGAVPPLACVSITTTTPATRPQTIWWTGLATIDIHSNNPGESLALAQRMQDIAPTIVGSRTTCAIADCQVESTQPVVDDGWTPTRFRQVVTVDVTAREP